MHRLCLLAYTALLASALPFALWKLARRYRHQKIPWGEYWGYAPQVKNANDNGNSNADDDNKTTAPLVWLHAVSVGEAVAAQALLNRLQDAGYRLLLTHTTLAGREWFMRHYPAAQVCALPFDFPFCVRRFFARSTPALGIVMEAEYWFNLLAAARGANIPLVLANARLPAKNARRYRHIARLMKAGVRSYHAILAQTAADAARLRCFGGQAVLVAGNLKFDVADSIAKTAAPAHNTLQRWENKKPILLAATRMGEETMLIDALLAHDKNLFQTHPLLIAPRHPERRDEIMRLLDAHHLRYAVRSRDEPLTNDSECYLADTLGEMQQWYAACHVAIIGGSFINYGGQNPFEAMRAGAPAIIGPHVDNYRRLVQKAVRAGALLQAANATALPAQITAAANNETIKTHAQQFCEQQQGALAKHWDKILPLLPKQ